MKNTLIISKKIIMLKIVQAILIFKKKLKDKKNQTKNKMYIMEKKSDFNKQYYHY